MQPLPLEQKIRVHPVALGNFGNRDAGHVRLLNDRQPLLRRERPPRLVTPIQASRIRRLLAPGVHLFASGDLVQSDLRFSDRYPRSD